MKWMYRMLMLFCVLVLLLGTAVPAYAADGKVTYAGNASQFVFEPGSKYSPTDLFPNFKDVMPGDSISQRIIFRNAAYHGVKVRVYMRALGAQSGSENFLSQMNLTVEKVKDTIMFDAAADQTAQLTQWTYLGTLYSGGEVELNVTLNVPVTLDNRFQELVGYLDWEFMIEELPIEPSDPENPKTGDQVLQYGLIMAGSASVLFLLIVWKRKKQEESA